MAIVHDRIVSALEARGHRRVASATRKYTVLARSPADFYFVGKQGALRTGRTVTNSISLTGTAWYNMLLFGRPVQ